MPNIKNGFGRYWMGNLVAALLGLTEDEIMNNTSGLHYRGTFDPDFGAQAGFFGPSVDQEKEFKVDPDGLMRFSTISAWDHSEDVENLIVEKFPGIELGWSCTDEFGNFHVKHNPKGFPELDVIAFNGWPYRMCDIDDLKRDMKSDCPGLEIPEEADADYLLSKEFSQKYGKWKEEYQKTFKDEDDYIPCFDVYEEE